MAGGAAAPDAVEAGERTLVRLPSVVGVTMIRHSCIHREHGVDYLIRVEQDERGFRGRWSCQACGREGLGADEADSMEDAVRAASEELGCEGVACDVCGKRFDSQAQLNGHMAVHADGE